MATLKEIFKGWRNLAFGNLEVRKLAQTRMSVCSKCHHASAKTYLHCEVCGCYIPAKARSPESECPLNFWR
jgi:hypothetical protein